MSQQQSALIFTPRLIERNIKCSAKKLKPKLTHGLFIFYSANGLNQMSTQKWVAQLMDITEDGVHLVESVNKSFSVIRFTTQRSRKNKKSQKHYGWKLLGNDKCTNHSSNASIRLGKYACIRNPNKVLVKVTQDGDWNLPITSSWLKKTKKSLRT